jgi:hypothetical protein
MEWLECNVSVHIYVIVKTPGAHTPCRHRDSHDTHGYVHADTCKNQGFWIQWIPISFGTKGPKNHDAAAVFDRDGLYLSNNGVIWKSFYELPEEKFFVEMRHAYWGGCAPIPLCRIKILDRSIIFARNSK